MRSKSTPWTKQWTRVGKPYFYEGEKDREFTCPNCAEVFLQVDANGEMEVKPEYRGKLTYRPTMTKRIALGKP